MRKYAVLISLIMCVLVCGTYATWDYVQADVPDSQAFMPLDIDVSRINDRTGVIEVTDNTLRAHIYNGGANKVMVRFSGSLTLEYIPSDPSDVDGISMELSVHKPYNCLFNGKELFEVSDTPMVLTGGEPVTSVTIEGKELASMIGINGTVVLDNINDYEALVDAIRDKTFRIVISMVTPPIQDGLDDMGGIV